MRDLGDVLADLSSPGDDQSSAHLYSTLAPVYDFIYERHFDYDAQLALVTGTVSETVPDAESVLEIGCGTGRLLAGLADRYEEVVGLERSEAMARRAREQTDEAEVVVGDATSPNFDSGFDREFDSPFDREFDAVVMLGRVTGHVTEEGAAERLAENCLASLVKDGGDVAEPGVLLFDYFPTERMEDDYRTAESFESERYRVERETHSTISDSGGGPDLVETEFQYEISDRETGESATVSETMPLRMFTEREVRDTLEDAGFDEVEIDDEGADGWPLVVARTAERGG